MNKSLSELDWNHIRSFLIVVNAGNLSKAAKLLHTTQPTIGRQISALETSVGYPLFDRVGQRLELNDQGKILAEHWQPMLDISFETALIAKGGNQDLRGHVTVTVTDVIGRFAMPEVIARVRELSPELGITMNVTDEVQNLAKREADIAVRNVKPEQNTLIAKRLKTASAHFYASQIYIDINGMPGPSDLSAHHFIAYNDAKMMSRELAKRGINIPATLFTLISNDSNTLWAIVEAGHAIGLMLTKVGDKTPWAKRVLPQCDDVTFDTWITTHQELRNNPSIRLVFDVMSEVIPKFL